MVEKRGSPLGLPTLKNKNKNKNKKRSQCNQESRTYFNNTIKLNVNKLKTQKTK